MNEFSKLKERIDNTRMNLQNLDRMRNKVIAVQDSIKNAKSMYDSYNDYMLEIHNKLIEMGIHHPEKVVVKLPSNGKIMPLTDAIAECTQSGNKELSISLISDTILSELMKHE